MSIEDDIRRAFQMLRDAPYQPHPPLLSPRCGLHDQHAPDCRSAICECRCHYTNEETA